MILIFNNIMIIIDVGFREDPDATLLLNCSLINIILYILIYI